MVHPAGLEPATIRLEGGCSIQLSYRRKIVKQLNDKANCWSESKDSNLGPPGPKPGALPDCATLRIHQQPFSQRTIAGVCSILCRSRKLVNT